jgi:SRSO17 transposase
VILIGRIPNKLHFFFSPLRQEFSKRAWFHFWAFLLYLSMGVGKPHLTRIARQQRRGRHRTRIGAFLKSSRWDETKVLDEAAWGMLKAMRPREGETLYLILDDTRHAKWGKIMAAVGKLYHHVLKRFVQGHTVVMAALSFRGITVPWRLSLYAKKEYCDKVKGTTGAMPFRKLTELAAEAIRTLDVPKQLRVVVLFDSFYLCTRVVRACRERGWHYVSVSQSNRNLYVRGVKRKMGQYGKNVMRRASKEIRLRTKSGVKTYRVAERIGRMNGIGQVKVVFSRRQKDRNIVCLVTDQVRLPARQVVVEHMERWHIEVLIKELKQNLGLGSYQIRSWRGIVRHLHLVALSHILLTHLGLKSLGAQARKSNTVLWLPTIPVLQNHARRILYDDALDRVIRGTHDKTIIRRLERYLRVA